MKKLTSSILIITSALALTGCVRGVTSGPGEVANLKEYVESIKSEKPKSKREPLPLLLTQEVFSYADHTTIKINHNPESALQRAGVENADNLTAENVSEDGTIDETTLVDNSSLVEGDVLVAQETHKPLRSPFDYPQMGVETAKAVSNVRPDTNRAKEALESYPLDSLVMTGTIGQGDGLVALIQSPDKVVYRVKAGQYLGQSDGKVLSVKENEIKLMELVSDGNGGWEEKEATILIKE